MGKWTKIKSDSPLYRENSIVYM